LENPGYEMAVVSNVALAHADKVIKRFIHCNEASNHLWWSSAPQNPYNGKDLRMYAGGLDLLAVEILKRGERFFLSNTAFPFDEQCLDK